MVRRSGCDLVTASESSWPSPTARACHQFARGQPGKLYGGKILAASLPLEGLVVALAADPDGEANDIRLVPCALPLVRAAVTGPRLWVADRQFCNLDCVDSDGFFTSTRYIACMARPSARISVAPKSGSSYRVAFMASTTLAPSIGEPTCLTASR